MGDHPAMGVYHPTTTYGDSITWWPLTVQGMVVKGIVDSVGHWRLFAGEQIIATGTLGEGDLNPMQLFTTEALRWSERIESAMAVEAEAREQCYRAHVEETHLRDAVDHFRATGREMLEEAAAPSAADADTFKHLKELAHAGNVLAHWSERDEVEYRRSEPDEKLSRLQWHATR